MHIDEVLRAVSDHSLLYLFCIVCSAVLATLLNYAFLRTFLSGLMHLQVSFLFNTGILLFGWETGAVSLYRVLHYFFYEFLVLVGVYLVYRHIIRQRHLILRLLRRSPARPLALFILAFNLLLTGIFFAYVPTDGSSRIAFMTASWFSYLRPLVSLLSPLGFILPIYLLDRKSVVLPTALLASSIFSNIASGSKASFVFGFLDALLVYRDLKGSRLAIPLWSKLALSAGIGLSAKLSLDRLNVAFADLVDRFIKFGDATIMAYYAYTPQDVAASLTTAAKLHRGVARLLGDRSAADIDTLFGFALNKAEYGAHAFTGPNAQVPSYMLCNYDGLDNLFGIASIVLYFASVAWFLRTLVLAGHRRVGILLLPFVVSSLSAFPQDYYQGASDFTLIIITSLFFLCVSLLKDGIWIKPQLQS